MPGKHEAPRLLEDQIKLCVYQIRHSETLRFLIAFYSIMT